ncbi:MAG: zinc ribbon domain-containing protein, partial [Leptolyngbyaceae cyanobacterium SL_7_1]|nr:zinc ribbon domain-containing protein [Leptolyngbyaceae cyanobacterium SL_7_1]
MLYCPNYNCQAANAETHRFCQKCRTPLPKHYLWAMGEVALTYQPGDLIDDRFLCKRPQIFLNTKPGLVPVQAMPVPDVGVPYLHLSPYQLHVPQIYEVLSGTSGASLLLLDQAAIQVAAWVDGGEVTVEPLPTLEEEWQQASALRQLNWLWQLAQLW